MVYSFHRYRRRHATRGRKLIGFRPGKDNSKRRNNLDDAEPGGLDTRTLYSFALCLIPKTSINDISQRQRDLVYIGGIKIDLSFLNNSGTNTNACWVNIALITPRNQAAPSTIDFFRGSNANSRSRDFDASSLSSLDFKTLPINTDDYIVHFHNRFLLDSSNSNAGTGVREFHKYVKIGRQFRYDNAGSTPTSPAPHLVIFLDRLHKGDTGGIDINAASVLKRATIYFRETQ